MADDRKKPNNDVPSVMAAVAAIVEAVLEGHGLTPNDQRPSPWKAAHREEMARYHEWRSIGWGRA